MFKRGTWNVQNIIKASVLTIGLFISPKGLTDSTHDKIPIFNENSFLHGIISLGGGAAFSDNLGKSQKFPIVNPVTDSFYIYSANNSNQTVGLFDSFLGVEWLLYPKWALQMGLGYVQTGNFSVKGSLLQGADIGSADQYSYNYTVAAKQLIAESKLRYELKEKVYPYLLLGLGGAFNKAKNYNTNVPPFLTFTREYKDNTHSGFSYTAGVGFDVDVVNNLRLGIGYRFADFGKVKLGEARIDTTHVNGTLIQDHLYTNEILAQVTIVV